MSSLLNINISIGAAKVIQSESLKDKFFSNRNVTHDSLVSSCPSSDYSLV